MTNLSLTSTYLREEKGGIAVLVAGMIFSLIAVTSLIVDIGVAKAKRVNIQAATDMGVLAGVHKLLQAGVQASAVRAEATNIAVANDGSGTYSVPELGTWSNGVFTAGGANPNAVRMTSTASVPTYFGKIFGAQSLSAASESIAAIGFANAASCLIPFGMEDTMLTNRNYGDVINIGSNSPGNWGKIDIDGNMSSNPNFVTAMTNAFCSRSVEIGDTFNSATGFAGVTNGFDARIAVNPIVTMPVVHGFSNGNSSVTVVGFISVELIMQNGNGNRWNGTVRILNSAVGSSFSGAPGQPYGNAIGLVK